MALETVIINGQPYARTADGQLVPMQGAVPHDAAPAPAPAAFQVIRNPYVGAHGQHQSGDHSAHAHAAAAPAAAPAPAPAPTQFQVVHNPAMEHHSPASVSLSVHQPSHQRVPSGQQQPAQPHAAHASHPSYGAVASGAAAAPAPAAAAASSPAPAAAGLVIERPTSGQHNPGTSASHPHPTRLPAKADGGGGGFAAFIGAEEFFKSSAELHKAHIAKHGLSVGLRKRLSQNNMRRQGSEKTEEDREAESEHQSLDAIPLDCDYATLVKAVGQGVAYYFSYLKFVMIINAVLCALALVSIVPHIKAIAEDKDQSDAPSVFYLSSYSPDTKRLWQASTVLGFLWLLCVGPIYRYYVDWVQEKRQAGEGDYVEDPFEGQYSVDTEDCVDRIPYPDGPPSRREQWCRRFVSMLVFIAVLILQGVINYYAQQQLHDLGEATTAIVLSGVVIVVNKLWEMVCSKLTLLEAHTFYSDFRRWECFKVFTFKIVNVVVLYLVKSLAFAQEEGVCPLESMGNQFALLVIVDITVTASVELVLPFLKRRCCGGSAEDGKSNEESKPEFVLSDEYVEVTYRQFIIFLGMPVMPFLPFLGLAGSGIEFWFDKVRLLRIAGKPKRTNNTYKNVLMFFYFMMAVGVLVGYPNGMAFVLAGSGGLSDNCAVYK